ncbi:MAG: hypothetical protein IH605_18640 [Burkholderiales bacterium]|nr:hypothetical protein [Burkholderiales bacterium]
MRFWRHVGTLLPPEVTGVLSASAPYFVLRVLDAQRPYRFPRHIIFSNRTAAAHYGNLSRLRAAAPWRRMLQARVA